MPYHHGKDGAIKVAAAGGSPSDLVAEVYEWEFNPTAPVAEATAMRAKAGQFKGGIPSATGSISCRYDPADSAGQGLLKAGVEFEFELYPLPETSGNPILKGTGIITEAPLTGSYTDIIDQSFSYQVDGEWTEDTVTP